MIAPFRWTFPFIAIIAAVIAVWAGSNEFVAVPAATLAVLAAALALWESAPKRANEPTPVVYTDDLVPVGASDVWFRQGSMSQEAIVLLLDRIERALQRPDLPTRTIREIEQLSRLPWDQFLGYVDERLAKLETRA